MTRRVCHCEHLKGAWQSTVLAIGIFGFDIVLDLNREGRDSFMTRRIFLRGSGFRVSFLGLGFRASPQVGYSCRTSNTLIP
jgi:hypothetical protein